MADVFSLSGEKLLAPGEASPAVVKTLRDLLAQAEAGELVGLAAITLWPDHSTGAFRVGEISRSQLGSMFCLMQEIAEMLNAD